MSWMTAVGATLPSPVDYRIYRGHDGDLSNVAITEGKAYAYVLAGNGVFKVAHGRHMSVAACVGAANIAGLAPLMPGVSLNHSLVPGSFLVQILNDARRVAMPAPKEAMYHILQRVVGPPGHALVESSVRRPQQTADAGHLAYAGGDDPDVICDLHSHCESPAFYSATDDRDELGLRFYAVIGKIFTAPEIRLRVGVYGTTMWVPVTALFDGSGPFVDSMRAQATDLTGEGR